MQRQIDGKTRNKGKVVYRLACNTPQCPNISTKIDLVEEAVVAALCEWTKNYELSLEVPAHQADTFEADLERLIKERESLEAQRNKLYDFLERGIYDEEIFLQRSAVLSGRISEAQGFIDSLIAEREKKKLRTSKDEFMSRVKTVSSAYALAESAAEKNLLLKSVFSRIDYEKNERGGDYEAVFELEFFPVVDFL